MLIASRLVELHIFKSKYQAVEPASDACCLIVNDLKTRCELCLNIRWDKISFDSRVNWLENMLRTTGYTTNRSLALWAESCQLCEN